MKTILARAVATLLVTFATFALIGLTAISKPAQAQGFCALHVPPVCTKLAGEVADLKAERSDLQAQLKAAAPGEKGAIAAQIKKLNAQIATKEKQLATCTKDNGKNDSPATFNGTATLTTNDPNFPGPFVLPVTIGLIYQRWVHDEVIISSFPALVVGPYDVPLGTNTTTVKLISANCGAVTPANGRIEIGLNLKFEQSHLLAGNSTLTITLSTEVAGGSRLTKSGNHSGWGEYLRRWCDGQRPGSHSCQRHAAAIAIGLDINDPDITAARIERDRFSYGPRRILKRGRNQ